METDAEMPNLAHGLILLKTALAIERTMVPFEADEHVIFEEEKDFLKLLHGVKKKASKSLDHPTDCLYPGCNAKSIKNSHSIQCSTSLKLTAEAGHLICPTGKSDPDDWISKVGYRKASVFPGFCTVHENVFQEFEGGKDFANERSLELQLFRTICREISVNGEVVRLLSEWLKAYIRFRNEKLEKTMYAELAKLGLDKTSAGIKRNTYRFNNNSVLYIKKHLMQTREYLRTLNKLKAAAFSDIQSGKDERFHYQAVVIDLEFPICLAGRGGLRFQFGSVVRTLDIIINVLPYEGKTYLVLGSFRKHHKYLDKYLENYIESPFNLLSMVEAWMLYGTDHWFLKPSIWDALDRSERKQLYDEIYNSHKNILALPAMMIFKQTRLDIIELYKSFGPSHSLITGQLEALMNAENKSSSKN